MLVMHVGNFCLVKLRAYVLNPIMSEISLQLESRSFMSHCVMSRCISKEFIATVQAQNGIRMNMYPQIPIAHYHNWHVSYFELSSVFIYCYFDNKLIS